MAEIVDLQGKPVETNREGFLIIRRPWPSMARTLWRDPERYKQQYWERIAGVYMTGDAARRDEDGYFWMLGRVDDVMNVSGHRLSTMEMESALVRHPAVAEAAVVGQAARDHGAGGGMLCHFEEGRLGPRRARRGTAQVGGARDRQLRQAGADPFHRRAAEDPQRENHAPAAAGDRHLEYGDGRRDHTGGPLGGDPARGAARRRIREAESRGGWGGEAVARAGRGPESKY